MTRVWVLTAVALAAAIVAEALLGVDAPGLVAVFGFVSCVVLILGSKALANVFVGVSEDYYEHGPSARATGTGAPEGGEDGDG